MRADRANALLRARPRLLLLLLLSALALAGQNPGPPGALVVGTEVLAQSGTQLFLPAGVGAREWGWLFEYQQATARAGLFTLELDSASDGNRWRSGHNLAAWRNAPLFGGQTDFLAGTLELPSDLLPTRFDNLFSPALSLSGGEIDWRGARGWRLVGFAGRNLISQGPYIPFFISAPDFLWGVQLTPPEWHRWQIEARYLHTRTEASGDPLLDADLNSIPAASNELFLDANWHLAPASYWLNEVAVSRAAASPAGAAGTPGNSFLSLVSGPVLSRPAYDFQAYALRQGLDYFPLSNAVVGDREGAYAAADFRPWRRWSFSGTAADLRNNVRNDAAVPTLGVLATSAAATFAPGAGYSVTAAASRTQIAPIAGPGAPASLTTAQAQASRTYGDNLSQFRWQDWITHAGGAGASAIQTEEFDQQRSFGASFVSAGLGVQEGNNIGSPGALSLHLNLAGNVDLGQRLTLFASGQIGRDLRDSSALSLTTLRTWVAEAQLHLPDQFELSAQFVRNAVVSRFNAQRLLLAGLDSGPVVLLPGNTQQVVFVRLTKSFRWGAHVPMWNDSGPAASLVPSYGSLTGVVFDDRARTGRPAPGDAGVAGVVLRLDGATATTDAHGRFQFNGVRAGSYTLEIDVDHLPVRYTAPSVTDLPVVVRASGTPQVQIPLQLVGGISGALEAPAGTDLGGVALQLTPGNQLAFAATDGAFRFDNVPPGAYRVSVLPDSLPPELRVAGINAFPVVVASGASVPGLRFELLGTAPRRAVQTVVAPVERIDLPPPPALEPAAVPPGPVPAAPAATVPPPLSHHCRPRPARRRRPARHRRHAALPRICPASRHTRRHGRRRRRPAVPEIPCPPSAPVRR